MCRSVYSLAAVLLHWLTAALILAAAGIGLYMVDLDFSPAKLRTYSWHKWVGITILLLTALRLAWRQLAPPPPPLALPRWQARLAASVHLALYVLLFAIPISGWLMSSALGVSVVYLGMVPLPDLVGKDEALGEQLEQLHWILNRALLVLVILHAAAALKHHFVDRDAALVRMLPFLHPRT